eukprot:6606610-Alexandrium_andersonii.AAC.1
MATRIVLLARAEHRSAGLEARAPNVTLWTVPAWTPRLAPLRAHRSLAHLALRAICRAHRAAPESALSVPEAALPPPGHPPRGLL